jgi:hypothetical protein
MLKVIRILISILLTVGIFCLSFMVLDRGLSLVYGFNFQPYGPYAPVGFTYWGHIGNGSIVALVMFLVFRIYDYGRRRGNLFLKVIPFVAYFIIGALVPYFNDAAHLAKHGALDTLPLYLAANDLYLFIFGLLVYRLARSIKLKLLLLVVMLVAFGVVHFVFYVPAFPEFYWG